MTIESSRGTSPTLRTIEVIHDDKVNRRETFKAVKSPSMLMDNAFASAQQVKRTVNKSMSSPRNFADRLKKFIGFGDSII